MEITGERKPGGYISWEEIDVIEQLPEHCTVFDVGANVGDFTRAVLERRPHARVIAFEAQQAARDALRKRFGERVTIRGALGSSVGRKEFFTDSPASQLGTFRPRTQIPEIQSRSIGEIEVDTVDSVCTQLGIRHVDLLKLDCEGHEYDVLCGSLDMLARDAVDVVYWEHFEGPHAFAPVLEREHFRLLLGDEYFTIEPLSAGVLYIARRRRDG